MEKNYQYDSNNKSTTVAVAQLLNKDRFSEKRAETLSAAANGNEVIQLQENFPGGTEGRVYRYNDPQSGNEHARDDAGNHWYKNQYGAWTRANHQHHSLHGRGTWVSPEFGKNFLHGLSNMAHLQGGWHALRPFGTGGSKSMNLAINHVHHPGRSYSRNMAEAAKIETGTADMTATDYAIHHGADARVNYNWCHLASFGMSGDDSVNNIVAASTHNNTEQMAIEQALYDYRNKGFTVKVKARIARGTAHLAEYIHYQVWYGNFLAYSRTMDARRVSEPTYEEINDIKVSVRRAIHKALSRGTIRRYMQGFTTDFFDFGR